MKNKIVFIASVVLSGVMLLSLAACAGKKDKGLLVEEYEIGESSYSVGDKFDEGGVTITAHMSDGTTKSVKNHLVFDEAGVKTLKLDENRKFTERGKFKVKVYILEQRDDPVFYLGEWKINVKIKK